MKLGYDYLLARMWEKLALVRVYTKKKGLMPDFDDPLVLTHDRNGTTVKSICQQIHNVVLFILGFCQRFLVRQCLGTILQA